MTGFLGLVLFLTYIIYELVKVNGEQYLERQEHLRRMEELEQMKEDLPHIFNDRQ